MDKKRGQRRDVGIIDQPIQFSLKNELGEVAVFSGVTGEFLRYQKPVNDGVLCYFEYPEEYMDDTNTFFRIKD